MKTNGNSIVCCCLATLAFAATPAASLAQVVINAPPTVIPNFYSLNEGETLNVSLGGIVGDLLKAFSGSEVNISGGNVGIRFEAFESEVNITGGNVGNSFVAHSGSLVNISGGTLGYSFDTSSGSEVNISGGNFGRGFSALSGSDVELIADEFRLNGTEFVGGSITLDAEDIFTGTLADGSSFIFSPLAGDDLQAVTLTQVTLPTLDLTPVVLNSPITDGPSGLRDGQMLTVQSGGELRNNFAVVNATLHVEGGAVGRGVEAIGSTVNISGGDVGDIFYVYSGSVVNISGGSVGNSLFARSGSSVNISGGNVGNSLIAYSGSLVDISGGNVGNLLTARSNSLVNISGGNVDSIRANSGSVINISGGNVGAGVSLHNSLAVSSGAEVNITGGTVGSFFDANVGSDVELVGGEFRLNGAEFIGDSITLDAEDIFTGTLADGSSFIFSPLGGDNLQAVTLTRTTLPTLDLTPRVVNSPVIDGPSGLRAGQMLTVKSGGVLPVNFAVVDATLNIEGGTVAGGGVEVTGGVVNISGGNVGAQLDAIGGVVNMSGGTLGERSRARLGSVVNISGGNVGSKFFAAPGSEVNISGGAVAFDFWARAGSDVELIGGDFRLNGATYTGGNITLDPIDIFTGTLADGSTFIFSPSAKPLGDELVGVTLTRVALPTLDLTPSVVNSPITGGPSGLRAGQTLTVQAGGVLQESFAALDAVLNVEGGVVGTGLEVDGSTVNISGGEVGFYFQAYDSEVNISGGEVGGQFRAHPGSTLNISGGTVSDIWSFSATEESVAVNISGEGIVGRINAFAGSVINMTGGKVDGAFRVFKSEVEISGGTVGSFVASGGSVVNVSGGTFRDSFNASFGNVVNISGGSFDGVFRIQTNSLSPENTINLFGTGFRVDGMPLDVLEVGEAFTITDRNVTLSGLLADGSDFSFELKTAGFSGDFFSPSTTLTVTLVVPEPASFAILTLGCCLLLSQRRSRSVRV